MSNPRRIITTATVTLDLADSLARLAADSNAGYAATVARLEDERTCGVTAVARVGRYRRFQLARIARRHGAKHGLTANGWTFVQALGVADLPDDDERVAHAAPLAKALEAWSDRKGYGR